MGWAGTKREQDTSINPDLQHFYLSFFNYSPTLTYLFPSDKRVAQLGQREFAKWVCGHCLHLGQEDLNLCLSGLRQEGSNRSGPHREHEDKEG